MEVIDVLGRLPCKICLLHLPVSNQLLQQGNDLGVRKSRLLTADL